MNKDFIIKNPEGAGRKRKFTDEELINIIDSFVLNEYKNTISASLIASYAKEKLFYEDIRYYHFTTRETVNNKIEEVRKERKKKYFSVDLQEFQNLNIDGFISRYIDNKIKLKEKLRDLQLGQLEMYNNMIKIDAKNRELRKLLKDCEENNQLLKEQNKDISSQLKRANEKLYDIEKLINVENHLKMLEYIFKNFSIESEDLTKQYIQVLQKCKVIKESSSVSIIDINIEKNHKKDETSKTVFLSNKLAEVNRDSQTLKNIEKISLDELDELLND